jgi:hypothetical protein
MEIRLEGARQAILENLAVASRGAAKSARGDPSGAVECADEVREVREADVERDLGDGPRAPAASSRAACRSRDRTRYWCGVTPSTLANIRRK